MERGLTMKRIDRACWDSLDADQRREYIKEAIFLRRVYHLPASHAVGTVRRMVRIGSWK